MNASTLDPSAYHSFPEFAKYGIPLKYVSGALVIPLQHVRSLTGIPIYPSSIKSGWVRKTKVK